eukprot:jgi/Botrbrau1/15610/Bobra.0264s0010.1
MSDESSRDESEPTGLPPAVFIEDVGEHLQGRTADEVIKDLNENHHLYKVVEQQLVARRSRLVEKLPEIQKSLDGVRLLQKKKDEEVHLKFALSEQIYAKAVVKDVEHVNVWLGADVMLEYPLAEAETLLESNLQTCRQAIESNSHDLSLIKDWITTTQVNLARVFNHDVSQRRLQKATEKAL